MKRSVPALASELPRLWDGVFSNPAEGLGGVRAEPWLWRAGPVPRGGAGWDQAVGKGLYTGRKAVARQGLGLWEGRGRGGPRTVGRRGGG